MTVAATEARQRHAGNGVSTQFSTVFTFQHNAHVAVLHTALDGTVRQLVEGGDYTLTGANTGAPGVVTTVSGVVPTGAYLTIMRNVPFNQTFNGEVLSVADAQDLEYSYDKIWMGMQELQEGLSRSFLSNPGGPGGPPIFEGWAPELAMAEDVERRVLAVTNWIGGSGDMTKPPVGMYIGHNGFTSDIHQGVDIRGRDGQTGAGTGDMLRANNLNDVASKIRAFDNLCGYGADVASAASINLDNTTGDIVQITGNSTIQQIILAEGRRRIVRFSQSLLLQYGGTLVLPGYASIQTQPNDMALFVCIPGGAVWCTAYMRYSGKPLLPTTAAEMGLGSAAMSATTDFLWRTNNLSDVTSPGTARANLGLGSAAQYNAGANSGELLLLFENNTLPALSGANLYNLPNVGQPIPNSAAYGIGIFMMLIVDVSIVTTGSIANGTNCGGNALLLPTIEWNATDGIYGMGGTIHPAGTWKNISGYDLGPTAGPSGTTRGGYFVRVA